MDLNLEAVMGGVNEKAEAIETIRVMTFEICSADSSINQIKKRKEAKRSELTGRN